MSSVDQFVYACKNGDESEVKSLLEKDPGLLNKQDGRGRTGLMKALNKEQYSLSRWLLSLPGLDTNFYDEDSETALHQACHNASPLDIVTTLVRLSTPQTINMKSREGWTSLMISLQSLYSTSPELAKRRSISRLLLSLPGLDTTNSTAVHVACIGNAPLDILVTLVRVPSLGMVNMKNHYDATALDWAVGEGANNPSAALYLSWLGAECKEKNKNCYCTGQRGKRVKHTFTEVTLKTWIEADCQQEAQFWAVAANDINALKQLARIENVTLEREKLRSLAKLFDHREVWKYVTSLESLAWEEVRLSSPALVTTPPAELIEKKVPGHMVGVILNCREQFKIVEDPVNDESEEDESEIETEESDESESETKESDESESETEESDSEIEDDDN